ncbi:hypothetical protein [Methylobacterium sp. WL120]|uniref:hypothetical protein n=1 Tax=Methylobacterium sp. WL120 TaxID=2603887 RepID=UPI00164F22AB|nr:hypothetical protein [Methylobacterium sp. WL120]
MACACLAICLAGCEHSDGPAAIDPRAPGIRITLPAAPDDVGPCLQRAFPEIPDRALTRADIVRIVGAAKILDRAKTACGTRAVAWIDAVRRELAR